jgi:CHAT domain-containing protein/cytochrome c-type biogenesis protein CcmH/NrfG
LQDANQHLDRSTLAKFVDELRQWEGQRERNLAQIHPHLTQCQACCEQLEAMAIEGGWGGIRVTRPGARQAECPNDEVWQQVPGGLVDPDKTLAYIEHASRCDHCGPLLRKAVEGFVDPNLDVAKPLTDAERACVASLESSRAEWQMRLAERISGTVGPSRQQASWWRRWSLAPVLAGATVMAVVVAGALWWSWNNRATPDAANRLLARAYTDQRTLELRIPDAAYGPLRVQRGPAESFTARPAPLLKAEALIASRLSAHPDDPAWLQAGARADVLEGKYDAAVESLQRALELQPHSPDVMFELATAHFQRAQSEDRQEDYAAAYELLSDVLAQQPENAPALFNRAIVAEHQFLYQQALDDWEHYLKLDSTSQWAEEARNRADAVRAKLKEHESGAKPLLTPEQIARAASAAETGADDDTGPANGDVERRVEQYLDAAVRTWLPQAYPERGPRDPNAQRALFFLADLTAQSHKDRWLSDLLRGSFDPRFTRAAAALAQASLSNSLSDYATALEQAQTAERVFRESSNQAGVARAEFEEAYAEQLMHEADACRGHANSSLSEADHQSYTWLQAQLRLEKAVCSLFGKVDWGGDEHFSQQAMELAQKAGYDGLYTRAIYFLADDQVQDGDLVSGLRSAAIGLQLYWSREISPARAYNLYDLLGSIPEYAATRPHLIAAAWREATTLADSTDDRLVQAWAHGASARAATSIGQPGVAHREYAEATRLLALAPKTDAVRVAGLWNDIDTARVESHLGEFDSGIARLTRIQDQIGPRRDKDLEEQFYTTLGELELRGHNPAIAEQDFRPALESAERRLSSLDSEIDRIHWSKEAAPVYLGMAEAELVQGRVQESLEYFEWYLGAASRSLKGGQISGAPDPTWLTSRLPLLSNQTVLAYAALPDGLAIWFYDNRGVNAQYFPQPNQNLEELAGRFYDLASDPKSESSAIRRDGQSLYSALIAPLESYLEPGRTLVIEADGWLARVPFEALIDSNGKYLIERAAIVHSLGQTTDATLHTDVPISHDLPALILASTAASQDAGLVPLPDVAGEADSVARDFHSAVVLKASEATVKAVEQKLPDAGIFHFTGHSATSQNGAALLLSATDSPPGTLGLLTADKLRRLNSRNLELAVLSTCYTSSGSEGARGFNNIAAALQRAGVPHVVASRWAVDSVETRRFIEDFYRNTLSGQPVSEAIRQTSRHMMADAHTSHPYYWSAFSAYGRP